MIFRRSLLVAICLLLCWVGRAQVVQDFNRSTNQIGDCWQTENMLITTKNTINKNNQKKALVGANPTGNPAYFFVSPLISFNGTGTIDLLHKLTDLSGTDRSFTLYLLDEQENLVGPVYSHQYINGGTYPNGNPTNVQTMNIPITWSGIYFLKFSFSGSGGGTSVAMLDDIIIDGVDVSDGSNDNGYGYCRPDDVVYDTLCAGVSYLHEVPLAIQQSSWNWDFWPGTGVGLLDTTVVSDAKDTMAVIDWAFTASGDYQFEVTEIRPPHNTTTYSILYNIHVLPAPQVNLTVDTVCPGFSHTATFGFIGNGPFEVVYTDGNQVYNLTSPGGNTSITLPPYQLAKNIEILSILDANGCGGNPLSLPVIGALLYPLPNTGNVFHY